MDTALLEAPLAIAAIVYLIPLILAASALMPGGRATGGGAGPAAPPWRRAERVAGAAFGLACLATGVAIAFEAGLELGPVRRAAPVDALTLTMLLLVTSIGWVIVRFSRRYLDGDPGAARALCWLQATLAAVTLLVSTDHLLMLAGAWAATSLALHQLLTHFADRPAALIAAHKKFIASRVAEVAVVTAVLLIARSVGSFSIAELVAHLETTEVADAGLAAAAVLLAFAAALKCAQMPFHGWLIQVMEAPTPVSALLHAGVVNIGGFLMIRLAPLIAEVEAAQLLLVAWGSANAVTAALVATTRVSIKVALAWSTSAQMGFMLLECGLGAYSLALLHLVAHSLYKAHAFLAAGSVVEQYRIAALLPPKGPTPFSKWLAGLPLAVLAVLPAAWVFGLDPRHEPALLALGPIFVFALVPFVVRGMAGGAATLALSLAGGAAIAGLYGLGHAGFGALLAPLAQPSPMAADVAVRLGVDAGSGGDLGVAGVPALELGTAIRIGIALAAFTALYLAQGWLSARPNGAFARALYPRLFAGLYLDDLFTRLTFRVWPARKPGAADRSVGSMAH